MGFAFIGVCWCGAALIVVVVAGAFLRLAVLIANRFIQPSKADTHGGVREWDWDDWDDEFDAPAPPPLSKRAIPEPGFFKCMAVVFVAAIISALGFVLIGFAAEAVMGLRMWREETRLAVLILDLPFAFLTLVVLLVPILPTTFWRAAMVAFLYGLLVIIFSLTIGAGLFVFAVLVR